MTAFQLDVSSSPASAEQADELGIEMAARPIRRGFARGLDTATAMLDLDDVGKRHDANRDRQRLAGDAVGDAFAIPAFVGLAERIGQRLGQAQPRRELSLKPRVRMQELADLSETPPRKRRDPSGPRQAGLPRTELAQDDQKELERLEISLVRAGFEVDVIAEPLCLLVRIGMAIDVLQKPDVVGRNPIVVAQVE
ncbi:MAG TPA: hypothetical protein VHR88_11210 [Solirubrobacteraceae bacterium]|jgi:hypothetical protein|nr:hypothetical protein [Solirubrobacteraceae bacterium]